MTSSLLSDAVRSGGTDRQRKSLVLARVRRSVEKDDIDCESAYARGSDINSRASPHVRLNLRALVREEIDVRIVLNEQGPHGTSDLPACLIDVHEHGD